MYLLTPNLVLLFVLNHHSIVSKQTKTYVSKCFNVLTQIHLILNFEALEALSDEPENLVLKTPNTVTSNRCTPTQEPQIQKLILL